MEGTTKKTHDVTAQQDLTGTPTKPRRIPTFLNQLIHYLLGI
jgi:hypothetical protein